MSKSPDKEIANWHFVHRQNDGKMRAAGVVVHSGRSNHRPSIKETGNV